LPAEAHDTAPTAPAAPASRAADPGTSIALPHEPFFSLTKNACWSPSLK
jgi:hypothetical protein